MATIGLKAALVPIVFDLAAEEVFGVAKTAVSRGLMYVLLALVLVEVIRQRGHVRVSPVFIPMAAFVGVAAVATAFAVHPPTAMFGAHHRYLGLTSILDGAVLAVAIALFVRRPTDLQRLWIGLFGGATVVIVYGGLQLLGLDPLEWNEVTVSSTIGNRGALGGYLVVIATAASARLLLAWTSILRVERVWLATLAVTGSALVVGSAARGPILALPVALAAATMFCLRRRGLALPQLGLRAAAVAVVAGGIIALLAAISPAGAALGRLVSSGDTSLAERELVYSASLEMVRSRPLLGAGPDGFAVLYPVVRAPEAARLALVTAPGQTSAHSWPLHHAVGTGLLGLLALTAGVLTALRLAWREARPAGSDAVVMGGVILVAFALQGLFNIPSVATEWFFWSGIGLAAVTLSPPELAPSRRDHRAAVRARTASDALPAVLAVALGTLLAATTLSSVQAGRDVHASDVLRGQGRLDLAERAASLAVAEDPGRANHWNVLGLARSLRDPARSLAAFERAWASAPYDSRYLINMIKEEIRLAEKDPTYRGRALADARKAVAIDPRNAETHMVLSFVLLKTGEPTGARAEAELAITLAPGDPAYYSWSAAIHEDTSDYRTAVDRYARYARMVSPSSTDLPQEIRIRLARLHAKAGDLERARMLIPPPRVEQVRGDDCGNAPTCVRIAFSSLIGLQLDDRPGSPLSPTSYRFDGSSPPAGTRVEQVNALMIVVRLPEGSRPMRTGTVVEIAGIRDVLGQPLDPDPSTTTIPDPATFAVSAPPPLPSAPLARVGYVRTDECGPVPPRCVQVAFDTRVPLVRERILDPGSYRLRGSPLPAGSFVEFVHAAMVIVRLPPDAPPIRSGDPFEVRGIVDHLGRGLAADPATFPLQAIEGPTPPGPPPLARVGYVRTDECGLPPPRCVQVAFDARVPLVRERILDPSTYRLRGSPLPPGSSIELVHAAMVIVHLPPDAEPLRSGDVFEVGGVVDELGRSLVPDPTVLVLP